MNNKEKIFTFNSKSWIGNLGKKSLRVQQPKCEVCNREILEEIEYSKVELEIERYDAEDMVSAYGLLIVSENLYNALINSGIKGFAPIKVNKVKYKYGDVDMKTVPTLVYLAILPPAVRNIPIASDFTGICEGCNLYLNKYNKEKSKLIMRNSEENAIHLQVFYDSYEGADIFNFADHGEIGVTQKFLDVIKDFNCPNNIIIPAEWI